LTLPSPVQAQEIAASGIIRAQEEVVVRSETQGMVRRIAVKEGQKVQEGDLLVELVNDRQKISLELSQARLVKAKASLGEIRVLLENAKKELARVQLAGDALPRKEVEDRGDNVLRLQATLEAQEAELKQAEVEINLRHNDLKETKLVAPFTGTVTRIYINQGEAIKSLETPVLELVALEWLYAELVLPVQAAHRVQPGNRVRVQVENEVLGRAGLLEGKVLFVNPKVDASSRTFRVKVGFSDSNGKVRPGMLAQVRFQFGPSVNSGPSSEKSKAGGKGAAKPDGQ
jgi:RND family efflux transporter MFP subunit